jgi:hypothetical protein
MLTIPLPQAAMCDVMQVTLYFGGLITVSKHPVAIKNVIKYIMVRAVLFMFFYLIHKVKETKPFYQIFQKIF